MSLKPRILISYFFGKDAIPLGASCADAFRELGYEVACFNSQVEHPLERYFLKWVNKLVRGLGFRSANIAQRTPWNNHRHRQHKLEQAVREFRPDIVFVIRGNSFDAETLRRIKQSFGVRHTVGWWVKDPRPDSTEMLDDAKRYDHYFCIHQFGYSPGDDIHHLPALAIDRSLYKATAPIEGRPYRHEIVFVGGWNKRRQAMVENLLDLPLEIYGPGWRKKGNIFNLRLQRRVKAKGIWGAELVELYNTSKIVLNITGWNTATYTGHNLRVFDVPACGAFLLTDYAEDLNAYFTPGSEIETYRDSAELREKILYYLHHDASREAVAKAGHQKAQGLPSVVDRMKRILDVVGEESGPSWKGT